MGMKTDDREQLGRLSAIMFKIHKLLLEHEFENREMADGKVLPPTERLNVLLHDPTMAWLRDLSRMMAFVDEVYYQKEVIMDRQMSEVWDKVGDLFSLQDESEFTYQYKKRLATVPDLMLEHGYLRAALKTRSSNN